MRSHHPGACGDTENMRPIPRYYLWNVERKHLRLSLLRSPSPILSIGARRSSTRSRKAIADKVGTLKAPDEIADQADRLVDLADQRRDVLGELVDAATDNAFAEVRQLVSKNDVLNKESNVTLPLELDGMGPKSARTLARRANPASHGLICPARLASVGHPTLRHFRDSCAGVAVTMGLCVPFRVRQENPTLGQTGDRLEGVERSLSSARSAHSAHQQLASTAHTYRGSLRAPAGARSLPTLSHRFHAPTSLAAAAGTAGKAVTELLAPALRGRSGAERVLGVPGSARGPH